MQFVEHAPERAEADSRAILRLREKTVRDAGVLELRQIHDAGPWIGEGGFLNLQDSVDLVGRRHLLNRPRGHPALISVRRRSEFRHFLSLAISASGFLMYSGRNAAGSIASDARAIARRPIVAARSGGGSTVASTIALRISRSYSIAPSPTNSAGVTP